ncbi:MAG: sugar O-acetyltransferase [Senegalia sp. (in: firmicutes)]
MTEKEKMIAGDMYDATDEELFEDRMRAKILCKKYNDMKPYQLDERKEVLKRLFDTENDSYIEPNFFCDYGYNIVIGKNFYVNHNCVILDSCKVEFGDNVMIGPNVGIYTATHPTDPIERNSGLEFARPIKIGENVWIGGGSTIYPGVTVGDNVVIAGGSVVTKSVEANKVVGGNPAKIRKDIK